ncbi:MAG: class I SAM-dependent methyltransferase [Pseudonocardiaceae bacterium]
MIATVPPGGSEAAPVQANITSCWHLHAVAYDEHQLSQIHMGPAKDAWADVWRSALPTPPADVLDVGTGTGQVALLLAELGHRVTGIDLADGDVQSSRLSGHLGLPEPFNQGDHAGIDNTEIGVRPLQLAAPGEVPGVGASGR